MGQRGRPRKDKTVDKATLSVDSKADATFISGARNFRYIWRAERSWNDEEESRHVESGIEVQFSNHLAAVGDFMHGEEVLMTRDEMVTAMLSDKVYGQRYCINESDPTGYWAAFKEKYGEQFEGLAEAGIKLVASVDASAAVMAQAVSMGFNRESSVHGIQQTFTGGTPPQKDGGRDRFTEAQEEAIAAAERI
jgi:hypothetical protein